ncbi:MAG: thioesterase family protein [Acidimicrobiales bacterium]
MNTVTATHFDRTIAVSPAGSTPVDGTVVGSTLEFTADFDPSWASLVGMHGGATAAHVVLAAQLAAPDRHVRTVAASFLRPGTIGPAAITVEVLRHGRSLTTLVGRVRQQDRTTAQVTVTLTPGGERGEWSAPVGTGVARPAPLAECVEFTPPPGIRHFEQARLLLDPAAIPGEGIDDARVAGHVQPIEPRPIDAAWLTTIGDWFPPAPFRRLTPPVGGISIDYTLHVHRTLPTDPDRWLEGVFDARELRDGIALEHGWLATPDGVPVAETFHTRWVG